MDRISKLECSVKITGMEIDGVKRIDEFIHPDDAEKYYKNMLFDCDALKSIGLNIQYGRFGYDLVHVNNHRFIGFVQEIMVKETKYYSVYRLFNKD